MQDLKKIIHDAIIRPFERLCAILSLRIGFVLVQHPALVIVVVISQLHAADKVGGFRVRLHSDIDKVVFEFLVGLPLQNLQRGNFLYGDIRNDHYIHDPLFLHIRHDLLFRLDTAATASRQQEGTEDQEGGQG